MSGIAGAYCVASLKRKQLRPKYFEGSVSAGNPKKNFSVGRPMDLKFSPIFPNHGVERNLENYFE